MDDQILVNGQPLPDDLTTELREFDAEGLAFITALEAKQAYELQHAVAMVSTRLGCPPADGWVLTRRTGTEPCLGRIVRKPG